MNGNPHYWLHNHAIKCHAASRWVSPSHRDNSTCLAVLIFVTGTGKLLSETAGTVTGADCHREMRQIGMSRWLYCTKYHHCSLYSSSEMNLNIRVKVRVDANFDGLTDKPMGGKPRRAKNGFIWTYGDNVYLPPINLLKNISHGTLHRSLLRSVKARVNV